MAVYRLRSDIRLERDAASGISGAAWRVVDPSLSRAIKLGDGDARMVRALAKSGSPAALAKELGQTQEEIAVRLAGLARLYLFSGKRTQLRIALQAERQAFARQLQQAPAADALEWLQGQDPPRHACQGNGTCCGATFLGPLTAEDVQRVGRLTFGTRLGPGSSGPKRLGAGQSTGPDQLFETVALGGRDYLGMARGEDERCLAQGEDLLCDIHREHGADAKPVACRVFPLRFYRSPQGIHVSLLLACDGYARARGAAGPWPARDPEIRALLAQGAPAPKLAVPVELSPGLPISWEDWRALRQQMLDSEPAEPDAHGWLTAVLQAAQEYGQRHATALAEGAETVTAPRLGGLAEALIRPAASLTPERSAEVQQQLTQRIAHLTDRGDRHDAQRLSDLLAGLQALQQGLALAPRGSMGAEPLVLRHLCDVVANDMQAHVVLGHLDAGLRTLTRRLLLTEAVACSLASRDGRAQVSAQDSTRALHVVYRSEPDIAGL